MKDERVSETKGGKFVQGTMSMKELLENVKIQECPRQPWSRKETHERFERSEHTGHRQLWLKCQNCSLEFIILTLRTETEAIEAYEPSHGKDGGLARKITCPECGSKGHAVILGARHHVGAIYRYTAGQFTLPLTGRSCVHGNC